MNVEEFDRLVDDQNKPPMAENGTRQDPENRPQLPSQVPDTAEINVFPQPTAFSNGESAPEVKDKATLMGELMDATQFEAASEGDTPTPSLENYLFNAVASQEGIFDFFKGLFKGRPSAHDAQAVRVLTNQYRNMAWLQNQTYNTGYIDVGSASRYLSNNGQPIKDAKDIIRLSQVAVTEVNKETTRIAQFKGLVDKAFIALDNQRGSDGNAVAKLVKTVGDVTHTYNALVGASGLKFTMGGAQPTVGEGTKAKDFYAPVATTRVPALDARGVYDVAAVILGLIGVYQHTKAELDKIDMDGLHYTLEERVGEYVDMDSQEMVDLMAEYGLMQDEPFLLKYLVKLIWALTVYIDKSINGVGGQAAVTSNESFGSFVTDALSKLFSGKPKVDEKTLGFKIDLSIPTKAKERIRETLLNEAWLGERESIEGKVKVVVPKFLVTGDYKAVVKAIEAAEKPVIEKNHKLVNQWFKENLEKTYTHLTTGKFDTWTAAGIEDMIGDVENIDYPTFADVPHITASKVSAELPALTPAQIKAVGQVATELVDNLVAFTKKVIPHDLMKRVAHNHGGKVIGGGGQKSEVMQRAEKIQDADVKTEVKRLIEAFDVAFTEGIENVYQHCTDYWQNYMDTIAALMMWVDKSLGGTVSKEEYKLAYNVSNEMISLPMLLRIFSLVTSAMFTITCLQTLAKSFKSSKVSYRRKAKESKDPERAEQLISELETTLDSSAQKVKSGMSDAEKKSLAQQIQEKSRELNALIEQNAQHSANAAKSHAEQQRQVQDQIHALAAGQIPAGMEAFQAPMLVSTEGFFDTLFSAFKKSEDIPTPAAKEVKKVKTSEEIFTDIKKGGNKGTLKGGEQSHAISTYLNLNKDIPDNLAQAIEKDMTELAKLIKVVQANDKLWQTYWNSRKTKYMSFASDAADPKEFEAFLKDCVAKQPKLVSESFREPSHTFLGYGKQPFLTDLEEGYKGFETIADIAPVYNAEFKGLDNKGMVKLIMTVEKWLNVYADWFDLEEDFLFDLDATDNPLRWFIREGHDDEGVISNNWHILYPAYTNGTRSLYTQVMERTWQLLSNAINLIAENHVSDENVAEEHYVPGRFGELAVSVESVAALVRSVAKAPVPNAHQLQAAKTLIQQTFGCEQWMAVNGEQARSQGLSGTVLMAQLGHSVALESFAPKATTLANEDPYAK